jgi:uncharacterized membrane protein YbhN (UPF0104 family)
MDRSLTPELDNRGRTEAAKPEIDGLLPAQASKPPLPDSGTGATGGRWWFGAVATLLAAVSLYYSLRGVDWANVWRVASGVEWKYVAVGTAFTCAALFLRSLRWRILLNAEARLDVATVFWSNMAGYLGNNFLPARGGELVRTALVSRRAPLSRTYVLTTALSERLMDAFALALIGSLALATVRPQPPWMTHVWPAVAAAAACGVLVTGLLPLSEGALESMMGRMPLPDAMRGRLLGLARQVLLGLRAFHHRGRLAGFVLLTATIWLGDACATVVGARALGFEVSFPVAVLLLTGLGLGATLPSTPGYVGIYQFVYVGVLTPFGMGRDGAVAFALFSQIMGYAVTLALGGPSFYWLRQPGPVRFRPGVRSGGSAMQAETAGAVLRSGS